MLRPGTSLTQVSKWLCFVGPMYSFFLMAECSNFNAKKKKKSTKNQIYKTWRKSILQLLLDTLKCCKEKVHLSMCIFAGFSDITCKLTK